MRRLTGSSNSMCLNLIQDLSSQTCVSTDVPLLLYDKSTHWVHKPGIRKLCLYPPPISVFYLCQCVPFSQPHAAQATPPLSRDHVFLNSLSHVKTRHLQSLSLHCDYSLPYQTIAHHFSDG